MNYRFQYRGTDYTVALKVEDGHPHANVNGTAVDFEILEFQPGMVSLHIDGHPFTLYFADGEDGRWVSVNGCTYWLEKPRSRRNAGTGETSGGDRVFAPMPAQVTAVQVSEGEVVEKGALLMLLEAMKMEIRIKSPSSGKLVRLPVKQGQTVDRDQLLAEINRNSQG